MSLARPLLERDAALVALRGALEDALAGRGRLALVSGEAGIGKTSLVRVFQETARGRMRVVSGACEALFTPRPHGRPPRVSAILRKLGCRTRGEAAAEAVRLGVV